MLVCPDCGSETFEQTRTTRTEYTLVNYGGLWYVTLETVVDGGDLGDEPISCTDCGNVIESDDELVTETAYNDSEGDEW
jgi:DNA-directed RNA polymerase subunit RPC12/RpoP